ncbi:MAG: hypothetical protein ACI93T_004505, partial [Porticoccaceae bacterium]
VIAVFATSVPFLWLTRISSETWPQNSTRDAKRFWISLE